VPPSPALSSHTANFPTSLQLCDNKPDAQSGLTSLNFLDAADITSQQKSSSATFNTVLGDRSVFLPYSYSTNAEILGSEKRPKEPTPDEKEKPMKKKKGKKEDDPAETSMTAHQREPAQDESLNPAPSRFIPSSSRIY
jgi:hypothetical protein